jgi:hypothetical protein
MGMKLEVLAYNPDGASIVRDSHDRVYIGPVSPPFGVKGRTYYLNLSTGVKVTVDSSVEVVNSFVPIVEPEAPRLCAYCNEPIPADAHHAAKYCSPRCKEMSKLNKGVDAPAVNIGSKRAGSE